MCHLCYLLTELFCAVSQRCGIQGTSKLRENQLKLLMKKAGKMYTINCYALREVGMHVKKCGAESLWPLGLATSVRCNSVSISSTFDNAFVMYNHIRRH